MDRIIPFFFLIQLVTGNTVCRTVAFKQREIEVAQNELENIQSQIANEVQVVDLEQIHKDKLTQKNNRWVSLEK